MDESLLHLVGIDAPIDNVDRLLVSKDSIAVGTMTSTIGLGQDRTFASLERLRELGSSSALPTVKITLPSTLGIRCGSLWIGRSLILIGCGRRSGPSRP